MKFMNDGFLLKNETARWLYKTAERQPIADYHCHLEPRLIAENYKFSGITELMLGGDHYKWRAMRQAGFDEKYITGNAPDSEKFAAYVKTLQSAAGNPLYHWTHLELSRVFGINESLTTENCEKIRIRCDELLSRDDYSVRNLIRRFNVTHICTTDDPFESLEWHKKIAADGFEAKVLPTYRPDRAIQIWKDSFVPYVEKTGVSNYNEFCDLLLARADCFDRLGCRAFDCSVERPAFTRGNAAEVFDRKMSGKRISRDDEDVFSTELMLLLAAECAKRGWVMQLHIGAMRNVNSKNYTILGADCGCDGIGDARFVEPVARLLDSLNSDGTLPRTILYPLNHNDSAALAALAGCFAGGETGIRNRVQLGAAWWFSDNRDGIEEQLRISANYGLLGNFVGMLTDSRSFVSYTRHEYFRRILCNLLGGWVDDGEYPDDRERLTALVTDICYRNAVEYFGF